MIEGSEVMIIGPKYNNVQYIPKSEARENIENGIFGLMTAGAIKTCGAILTQPAVKGLEKMSKDLSENDIVQIKGAIPKVLKNSGLEDKGVKVYKAGKNNVNELKGMFEDELAKGLNKFIPKKIRERQMKSMVSDFANGGNAAYFSSHNLLILPEHGVELACFHEAGHAVNNNLSKAGKMLQNSRQLALLALPIALIALFKPDKKENEKPKGIIDKATDFIKDNAGKLTLAAWAPVVLEEGLASLRGNKMAKELLSPDLAKKVAKSNAFGFATYLSFAAFSAFGVFAGKKAKETANRTDEKLKELMSQK